MIRNAFFLLCLGFAFPTMASAQTVEAVEAEDTGWYRDDGFHEIDNENYLTGIFEFASERSERNSFFVFDLSGSSELSSATLRLSLPTDGYNSPDTVESFSLFEFGGDVTSLIDGTGGIGAFDDLGQGISFGSVDISQTDENSFVDIELNSDGVAFLNSSLGGTVAIGGSVTSLVSTAGNEYVFGETDAGLIPIPTLVTVAVPEPSSIAFIGLAFALATSRRRR